MVANKPSSLGLSFELLTRLSSQSWYLLLLSSLLSLQHTLFVSPLLLPRTSLLMEHLGSILGPIPVAWAAGESKCDHVVLRPVCLFLLHWYVWLLTSILTCRSGPIHSTGLFISWVKVPSHGRAVVWMLDRSSMENPSGRIVVHSMSQTNAVSTWSFIANEGMWPYAGRGIRLDSV